MSAIKNKILRLFYLIWLRFKTKQKTKLSYLVVKRLLNKVIPRNLKIGMTRETLEVRILQEILNMDMIRKYIYDASSYLDVGANIGMNSLAAFFVFDQYIPIVMIEPSIDCHPALEFVEKKMSNITLMKLAVGDDAYEAEFNRSLSSSTSQASSMLQFSSIYKTTQSHANSTIIKDKVNVVRLDNIERLENLELGNNIVMHIDVEGFEYQALVGAKAILERTKIITLEASRSLFVNQKSLDDIYMYLRDTHQLLCALGNPMISASGEILVQDYIFLRKTK